MEAIKSTTPHALLLEAGIKPSPQRVAILGYVMSHLTHPTVDEIFQALSVEYPTLSRTTVYNTLWLMAERGVIESLDIERNNARFDYACEPHGHFRCQRCGRIFDVPLLEASTTLPQGLHVEKVNVYYKGLCNDCFTATNPNQ
ncbi:MAG: transcriptional repressor [Bacteroidales bacterium]|nr:transcriptional repressor [Bacteroidales bacterium]